MTCSLGKVDSGHLFKAKLDTFLYDLEDGTLIVDLIYEHRFILPGSGLPYPRPDSTFFFRVKDLFVDFDYDNTDYFVEFLCILQKKYQNQLIGHSVVLYLCGMDDARLKDFIIYSMDVSLPSEKYISAFIVLDACNFMYWWED